MTESEQDYYKRLQRTNWGQHLALDDAGATSFNFLLEMLGYRFFHADILEPKTVTVFVNGEDMSRKCVAFIGASVPSVEIPGYIKMLVYNDEGGVQTQDTPIAPQLFLQRGKFHLELGAGFEPKAEWQRARIRWERA